MNSHTTSLAGSPRLSRNSSKDGRAFVRQRQGGDPDAITELIDTLAPVIRHGVKEVNIARTWNASSSACRRQIPSALHGIHDHLHRRNEKMFSAPHACPAKYLLLEYLDSYTRLGQSEASQSTLRLN